MKEEKDIRDWLKRGGVKGLGISRTIFNNTREELSKRFKSIASINDTIWSVLNNALANKTSYYDRMVIYMEMAHILKLENKDTKEVVRQARKMELLEHKEGGYKMVEIMTMIDDTTCAECKKLAGKVLSIEEALKNMPVPNNCTNKHCRCWYGLYIDLPG